MEGPKKQFANVLIALLLTLAQTPSSELKER